MIDLFTVPMEIPAESNMIIGEPRRTVRSQCTSEINIKSSVLLVLYVV